MYIVYNSEYISVYDNQLITESSSCLFPFCKELEVDSDIFTFIDNVEFSKLLINKGSTNNTLTFQLNGNSIHDNEIISKHNDLVEIKNSRLEKSFYILYLAHSVDNCSIIKLENSISIGRSSSCDIIIEHPAISRQHAQITKKAHSAEITKLSSNGYMYVNGFESKEKVLDFGDAIRIMGTLIIFMGEYVIIYGEHTVSSSCTAHTIKEYDDEITHWVFNSAPRILRSVDHPRIVIDPPTQLSPQKPVPFILAVGPSLTMSLAMLVSTSVGLSSVIKEGVNSTFVTSLVMAFSMLAGAIMWPALLRKHNKKQEEKSIQLRKDRYLEYLQEKDSEIQEVYNKNLSIREKHLFPEVANLISLFDSDDLPLYLWERTPADEDFLHVRLGKGSVISDIEIQTAEKRFTIEKDNLLDLSHDIAEQYRYYDESPIGISLMEHRIIGLFGTQSETDSIIKSVIANICILHNSNDVKTAFLYTSSSQCDRNKYIHDIPHIWDSEKHNRYLSSNEEQTYSVLNEIYKKVCTPQHGTNNKSNPHYVIFTYTSDEIVKTSLYQVLQDNPDNIPVTIIFISRQYGELPHECQAVIQGIDNACGIYVKNSNNNRFLPFVADTYNDRKLQYAISGLSKIEKDQISLSQEVPNKAGFLDMFRVGNIDALRIDHRWKSSKPYQSLATPIGIISDNEVLNFDIHEAFHGCHGIVAGTTGSGKSEFLQAYILSMMVNYSPKDVNFMLVDFKGGDIAIPFDGIPHVSAVVSNLTKAMLYRAIISLQAEKNKRQILFAETARRLGMDKIDINSYQKLYKNGDVSVAVPHLIIIMDEFAQFKTQHSEYMQDLIDIAQIGRSLGIHLILATQKPAGVVDGQIWSNSRFKFCLKVLEREDSKAVLQRDEAAYITNPGRGYMQVGYNEIFNQFQSGYCRAKYIPSNEYCDLEDLTISMIDVTGKHIIDETDIDESIKSSAPTQINAITEAIRKCSEANGYQSCPLWLPQLENNIFVDDCISTERIPTGFLVGMMDIPSKQQQKWYIHDFVDNGSIALYGASGSGKTTMIQSILYQGINHYTPNQFKYAVIDMSGRSYSVFANTPYSFGVASASESDAFSDIFDSLEEEIAYRKEKFAEIGCNSYAEYNKSKHDNLPIIVFVLENYAKFRESEYQHEDRLINLLNGGQAFGLYFIITTNSKSGIYYKVREQLSTTIVFKMIEADVYRDLLGTSIAIEPDDVKGRALIVHNEEAVEIQVALPVHSSSESERSMIMRKKLSALYKHTESSRIPKQVKEVSVSTESNVSQVNLTVETPSHYSSVPEKDGVLYLGNDIKTHSKVFAESEIHNKTFICSQSDYNAQVLCKTLLTKTNEDNVFILWGKESDIYDSVLSQLDVKISEGIKPILLIPNFVQLYSDISNEGLDILVRYIRDHQHDVIYITCSSLKDFIDFNGTDLQVYLCKQANITTVVGGTVESKYLAALSDAFVKCYGKSVLDKKLKNNQMLSVIGDEFTVTYVREDM